MDVLRKLEAYLIYILGCAHLLFQLWTFSLCIHCKTKIHWFHKKKIVDFENLLEIEICWRQIFKILIIHKPSLGSCEVPQKTWAESVQPFSNTNKQTFRQTDRQAKYIFIYLFSFITSSFTPSPKWPASFKEKRGEVLRNQEDGWGCVDRGTELCDRGGCSHYRNTNNISIFLWSHYSFIIQSCTQGWDFIVRNLFRVPCRPKPVYFSAWSFSKPTKYSI